MLYMYVSGNSMLDYAPNLKDGQFICENGYIYETVKEYNRGLIIANRVGHSGCRFTVLFGRKPAEKLLPHEYALQTTDRESIFMDNQGTVWLYETLNYAPRQARLTKLFLSSAELDTLNMDKLQIYTKSQKLSTPVSSTAINSLSLYIPFKAELTSELNTYRKYYQNTSAEFSVKLKDGWYALDVDRPNTQYSIDPNQPNQSIKLLNLGQRIYLNTRCRLIIYDKNTCKALSQCEFDLVIKKGTAYIEVFE